VKVVKRRQGQSVNATRIKVNPRLKDRREEKLTRKMMETMSTWTMLPAPLNPTLTVLIFLE